MFSYEDLLNFYLFYNIILGRDNLKEHREDIYIIVLVLAFSITFYFINDLNLSSVFINVLSSVGTSGISTRAVPENFGLYFIILTHSIINAQFWSHSFESSVGGTQLVSLNSVTEVNIKMRYTNHNSNLIINL